MEFHFSQNKSAIPQSDHAWSKLTIVGLGVAKKLRTSVFLSLLLVLFCACYCSTPPTEEQDNLPQAPIPVYYKDCIWIIDSDAGVISHGPFCLSGFWRKVRFGDVQIVDKLLYVTILESWEPESGAGKTIAVIDPVTGKQVEEIEVPASPQKLLLAEEDDLVYVSAYDSIAIVDLEEREAINQISLDLPCLFNEMALDFNGMLYISACKSLFSIDTATNSVRGSPAQFDFDIEDIQTSSNGYLYLLFSRTIELVDPQSWEVMESASLDQGRALDVAVSDEHEKVYVLRNDKTIEVFSTDLDRSGTSIPLPNECSSIVGMNNGDVYLLGEDGGEVLVLDMNSKMVTSISLSDTDK